MKTTTFHQVGRLVLTLLAAIILHSAPRAQCTTILPFDNNEYTSSLERFSWKPKVIQQDCPYWCWAAVSESVLKFFNFNISQQSLATQLFGDDICEGANCNEIITNLNHLVFTLDSPVAAYSCPPNSAAECLAQELSACKPLIAGLNNPGSSMGHAYVVIAVTYEVRNGTTFPNSVILVDPWPTVKNPREKMNWTEFRSRLNCLIRFEEQ
jgi:hypothetical protein